MLEPPSERSLDRRTLLTLAAFGLGALAAQPTSGQDRAPQQPFSTDPIDVTARPITAFERAPTGKTRFGALEFRGGLELTSTAREFGGWSGLVMSADGRRLLAVSDQGSWLTADLVLEADRPHAVRNAVLGPILGTGGRPLDRKRDADAEAATLLDGTLARGTVLVTFERNHRIGRYPVSERGLGAVQGYLKLPADARRMRSNAGLEAVCVVRGGPMAGSIVAFAEELRDAHRNHTGWIWPGGVAGEPQRLGLVDIGEFAITDLASLANGSLIVLERRFRWLEGVQMRLRRIAAAAVRPGADLDGEVLCRADSTYEIDNMECLALHTGTHGETILTLLSDDNFNRLLQRTLLLQFALVS